MNEEKMSNAHADAIGKSISTVLIGLLAIVFLYAYLGNLLFGSH